MICSSFDELINSGYNNFRDITGIYEKINGVYSGKTFGEFYSDVRNLSKKLLDTGLSGKNIMLYGKNSYNWMVVYLAVAAYVGAVVPIDKEWKYNDIINVLSALNIDYIFHSDTIKENLHGIYLPKVNLDDETAELIHRGRELDIRLEAQNTGRVCAVFFTSGTTSAPKKVELTEKNFFANADGMAELVSLSTSDRYMVSLPLNHIGTAWANFIAPIAMGASLYIPNDFKEISEDLKLICPTVLYGVPRVFEKLWESVSANPKVKGVIKVSNFLRKIGIDRRKKLFAELHGSLGGAVRFAYNGAAKLNDELIHVFNDMGLVIMQAYGMTETTAIVSCDSIRDYRLGSTGKVLFNQVCVIIGKDAGGVGEICVKGDNVADCAIAADGYLHTGDLGYFDRDGYLFVTGRKKRLIKLSNAKNVYPDELENLLLKHKEIEQIRVYEKNNRIVADVVSGCDAAVINGFIDALNDTLPYYKQIRHVLLVDRLNDVK